MSLSITTLRSETLDHLGIDATDLDATGSANLDLIINRSFWSVCDEFRFKEKEQTDTFVTVSGTRRYTILTEISPLANEAIQSVSYTSLNDLAHVKLRKTTPDWYEENYIEQTTLDAAPERWFHNNGYLYLYPTPDTVYTVTLWFWYTLSDLSDSNTTIDIPRNWHEAVLYGAIERGFLRARDFTSAEVWNKKFAEKIGRTSTEDATEDALTKDAGARVIRPTYSVRHR